MEYLHNPIIIGLIASILSIILYFINIKVTKEESQTSDYLKVGTLGLILGMTSIFIYNIAGDTTFPSLDQDILTGNPNF